jgi:CXXX repeat modification system protein
MIKEKVGEVTVEEKEEIERLYERKTALNELLMTLNNPSMSEEEKNILYEKILLDMGKTKRLFDKWWDDAVKKYQWKGTEQDQWSIDFKTNEIFLIGKA